MDVLRGCLLARCLSARMILSMPPSSSRSVSRSSDHPRPCAASPAASTSLLRSRVDLHPDRIPKGNRNSRSTYFGNGREGSRSRVGCANDRPCESTRYLLYEIALAPEPPTVVAILIDAIELQWDDGLAHRIEREHPDPQRAALGGLASPHLHTDEAGARRSRGVRELECAAPVVVDCPRALRDARIRGEPAHRHFGELSGRHRGALACGTRCEEREEEGSERYTMVHRDGR